MAISPDETQIVGRWVEAHGELQPDAACRRIERLVDTELERLAADPDGGWDALYRDPDDGRLWECVYTDSDFHGAGPPTLQVVGAEAAAEKYGWEPEETGQPDEEPEETETAGD